MYVAEPQGSYLPRTEYIYNSISFAWLKTNTNALITVSDIVDFRPTSLFKDGRLPEKLEDDELLAAFRSILSGQTVPLDDKSASFSKEDYVTGILWQDIVVEYSPPSTIPLSQIVKMSTHSAIGYYIGSQAAAGNHWLLLITVPGAIVVVGAALGVSDGLVRGLAMAVERAVSKWVP